VNGWHMVAVLVLTLFSATGVVEAHELTPQQLGTLTFDQRPGQQVPPDIRFADENGQAVMLGDYFGQRPLILTLNYFHCQNLCPLELDGLMNGLNGVSFTLGQDFGIVSASIDPREGPAEATAIKTRELRGYDQRQSASDWHVLTGARADIDRLAQSVGFNYAYDPDADEYAHPLGVVVLTPDGHISRYLYGLDFSASDLRLALVDASAAKIGTLLDQAALVCYHYDPLTGRYTPLALNLVRGGGAFGVLATIGLLGWLWRFDVRRKQGPPGAGA
jgi:protein SCO1